MRLGIPGSTRTITAMPNAPRLAYSVGLLSKGAALVTLGGSGLATVHMLQQVFEP